MKYLYALLALSVALYGAFWSGEKVGAANEKAAQASRVSALNAEITRLGVKIQTETNTRAEAERQARVANLERINANAITDHKNRETQRLQDMLDRTSAELAKARSGDPVAPERYYRVVDVGAVARVYEQARSDCHGLPPAVDSPIISAPVSEFTGDQLSEAVRYLVGAYCSVALDYNHLYRDASELLEMKTVMVEHPQ